MKTLSRAAVVGLALVVSANLFGATDPAKSVKAAAHSIPNDQIVAAAASVARAPVVTEATARGAAQRLLAQNSGVFSNADVEKLAVRILQQANKDADADLKAQQAAMRKSAAQRKAQPKAATQPTVQVNLPSDTNLAATPTTGAPGMPDAVNPVTDPAAAQARQAQADKDRTAADQARLQTLQDRKTKFAQLLSSMQQQVSLSGGTPPKNP